MHVIIGNTSCLNNYYVYQFHKLSELTAFYRYWRASITDHFYTSNIGEIGTSTSGQLGRHGGYTSEGVQCLLYTWKVAGTVPLYRYWNGIGNDHFYTTNIHEIGTSTPGVTRHGYRSEGIAGYCFPHAAVGTIPLYRYWRSAGSDHFYTTNSGEIGTTIPGHLGKHGYTSEGVACYVIVYHG